MQEDNRDEFSQNHLWKHKDYAGHFGALQLKRLLKVFDALFVCFAGFDYQDCRVGKRRHFGCSGFREDR